MSHSYHFKLSKLLVDLPDTPTYYFYLDPEYHELEKQIETLTNDMYLVTVKFNLRPSTILFEYHKDGEYDSTTHEKVYELMKNKFIYLYQHEDIQLKTNTKSMLHWLHEDNLCSQLYLYEKPQLSFYGTGYLILAPPEEERIHPRMKPIGTSARKGSFEVRFKNPSRHLIYADLKNFGKRESILAEQRKEIQARQPSTPGEVSMNFTTYLMEYKEKHPEITKTNNYRILEVRLNAVEQPMMTWQSYLRDKPYVTERQVRTQANGDVEIAETRYPSFRDFPITEQEKVELRQRELLQRIPQPGLRPFNSNAPYGSIIRDISTSSQPKQQEQAVQLQFKHPGQSYPETVRFFVPTTQQGQIPVVTLTQFGTDPRRYNFNVNVNVQQQQQNISGEQKTNTKTK